MRHQAPVVQAGPEGSRLYYPALTSNYVDWTEDLYLMAHYTSTVSATLMINQSFTPLFQKAIPQAGIGFPHTMHCALAVSATHLVRTNRDQKFKKKYRDIAAKHHHFAVQQFQETVKHVTPENITATFLTSSLLSSIAMTVLSEPADEAGPLAVAYGLDEVLAIFTTIRGLTQVLFPSLHWLKDSRVFGILQTYTLDDHSGLTLPEGMAAHIANLRDNLIMTPRTSTIDNSRDACLSALYELECLMKNIVFFPCQDEKLYNKDVWKRHDLETGVVMKWGTQIPDMFVNMIRQRHPVAIIIVGTWAVLWKHWDHIWYSKAWAINVFKIVLDELSDVDKVWMDWPRKYLEYR